MRYAILAVLLTTVNQSVVFSQTSNDDLYNTVSENYFFAGSAVYSKMAISPRYGYGSDHLKSKPTIGYQAGYAHSFPLASHWQLSTGVKLQIAGRNHQMYIPKTNYLPNLMYDVDDYGLVTRQFDFFASAPILIKYFKVIGKSVVRVGAGVDVNFSPVTVDDGYTYFQYNQNNILVNVYEMYLTIGEKRIWVNPTVELGYGFLLKNHHSIEASLNFATSFTDVVKGRYITYTSGATPSDGTFTAKHSYLGLMLSYHLSRYKKKKAK